MSQVPAIDANRANQNSAIYNAVKIQINNPQANIADGITNLPDNNGTYNAVDIEINKPSIETEKKQYDNEIYEYPAAQQFVTSDIAPIHPIEVPSLPVAYNTNNYFNNRTLINAEVEVENKFPNSRLQEHFIEPSNNVTVPEPNITTTADEKSKPQEIVFHGINFKANEAKREIEIVPPVDIKPDVDVSTVVKNLANPNYDIQAKQMEEIARVSMEDSQKAVPYIVTEIFTELENIVKKDSSKLEPPTEKQIELRKQIILNEIVKEQARVNKQDSEKIELPFNIKEQDIKEASVLSSMEQAERNKEYALYTMAVLTKVYADEVEKHTGNVVPLTDLPGVSIMVDSLRENSNAGVKISAIDSLRYINRPEYAEELSSIFRLAANDSNPYVARNAAMTLEQINQ